MPMTRRSPTAARRAVLRHAPFEEHYGVSRLSDRLTTPEKYYWYTLKNCYVSKTNWIQQRNGFTQYSGSSITGAAKVRKLFEFINSTGGATLIGRSGTRWVRYSGTTPVDLDTGRSSDARGQCAQFNNELIMCDGGAPRKSTASWSVSSVGSSAPSRSSAVHVHNFRVVMNNDDNYMEVYVSKVGSLDFSTATNDAIVLNLSKVIPHGDRVIGFSTFLSTFLVIWLKQHVVVYNLPTTYDDIALEQVIPVGCLSYEGIIETPDGDLWFPSETGYKSMKESMGTKSTIDIKDVTALLGPHYRDSMRAVSDTEDIVGVYYKRLNHGYFKIPLTNEPEIWVISEDLRQATRGKGNISGYYTGINPYSFCQRQDGTLLFGGNDGHVYKMDDGANDNGVAVSFEAEKTGLYFGDSKVFKAPREFEALLEATKNLTAYLEYSFGTAGLNAGRITETIDLTTQVSVWDEALWDQSYWDAAGQTLFRSRNLVGRGKVMHIRLRHSTLDAQLRFPYWIIGHYMEGDK